MKIDYKTAYENVMIANKMLEKEIERLNKQIEEYQKTLDETTSEKIDLENIIKEVREYIKTLRNYRFKVDLGENREQLEIVGSTENFIKDILEILDKENK